MKRFAIFLPLAFASLFVVAQTEVEKPSTIFQKLTAVEGMEITLETDLTTFISQKKTNNYLPGKLRTKDGKSYAVEVRPRGRYRRKVSQIPPMKIRFSEKELRTEALDTLNEIKVALPCFDSELGDELIVKEYLAYQMFKKTSDAHFRAGLVKLTLIDTNEKKSGKKVMYAILVEDEEEAAQRLGGVPEEEYGIPLEKYEPRQTALVTVFQYLIGNTDWDFSMHRNVELIKLKENGQILPMPYDFDFSGLVSAPYASPSSESGVKTVRDRYLMSAGQNPDSIKEAVKVLKTKEKELYQLCASKYLSATTEGELRNFLGIFFKNVKGKDEVPTTMNFVTDKE